MHVLLCDMVTCCIKLTSITSCYTNEPIVQVRHTIMFEFTSSFVTDCFVLEPHQSRVFRGWPAPIECCKRFHAETLVVSSRLKPHLRTVCAGATAAACTLGAVSFWGVRRLHRAGWLCCFWCICSSGIDDGSGVFSSGSSNFLCLISGLQCIRSCRSCVVIVRALHFWISHCTACCNSACTFCPLALTSPGNATTF